MEIRRAAADDAEQIASVHVGSWQVGYAGILPQTLLDGLDAAQRVPRWRAEIAQSQWPGRGTLVAEEDGVLGFALICPSRDDHDDPARTGEVASFYVRPDAWGRGVGRALMTRGLETMRAAGYDRGALWVLDGNARAIAFYSALGWAPDGCTKDDTMAGTAVRELRYVHSLG